MKKSPCGPDKQRSWIRTPPQGFVRTRRELVSHYVDEGLPLKEATEKVEPHEGGGRFARAFSADAKDSRETEIRPSWRPKLEEFDELRRLRVLGSSINGTPVVLAPSTFEFGKPPSAPFAE